MRRHVISDCGAPWNISTGGPEPPITALISAPDVLILSLRKLAGNKCFHARSSAVVTDELVTVEVWAFISAAAPEARTACCSMRRRVSSIRLSPELVFFNQRLKDRAPTDPC